MYSYRGRLLFVIALALFAGGAAGCVQFTPEYFRGDDYDRAVLLYREGDFDSARMVARRVPEGSAARDEAEKLLRKIDATTARIAAGHLEIAEEYEKAGIYTGAMKEYRKALKFDPGNRLAGKRLVTLKTALASGETPSVSLEVERKASEKAEGGSRGGSPEKNGEAAKPKPAGKPSREEKKTVVKGVPEPEVLADSHYVKGKAFLEKTHWNEAIEEFEAVLEILPFYLDTRDLLDSAREARENAIDLHLKRGMAFFQREEVELALKEWDRVLELDPDNEEAADYRARAEVIIRRLHKIRQRQSGEKPAPLFPTTAPPAPR